MMKVPEQIAALFCFAAISATMYQALIYTFTRSEFDFTRLANTAIGTLSGVLITAGLIMLRLSLEPKPLLKPRRK
jgi:hypothetical protein